MVLCWVDIDLRTSRAQEFLQARRILEQGRSEVDVDPKKEPLPSKMNMTMIFTSQARGQKDSYLCYGTFANFENTSHFPVPLYLQLRTHQ